MQSEEHPAWKRSFSLKQVQKNLVLKVSRPMGSVDHLYLLERRGGTNTFRLKESPNSSSVLFYVFNGIFAFSRKPYYLLRDLFCLSIGNVRIPARPWSSIDALHVEPQSPVCILVTKSRLPGYFQRETPSDVPDPEQVLCMHHCSVQSPESWRKYPPV